MSDPLASASVERVRRAAVTAGVPVEVIALASTARTAEDAAASVGCALGAIVKSLVFEVDGRLVLALVAGDRRCDTDALARAFDGATVARADGRRVRDETGFAIGGVAPIGHLRPLPTAIDAGLRRFQALFAAAGHPHCVFRTTPDDLARLTSAAFIEGLGVEG